MPSSFWDENLDWLNELDVVRINQMNWLENDYYGSLAYISRVQDLDRQIESICKREWIRLGTTYYFRDPKDAMMAQLSIK